MVANVHHDLNIAVNASVDIAPSWALQYSSYMDDHSEEDIWKRIKASLDAYAQLVKARGDKEFSPIYPLMMSLGQSLLEDHANGSK